MTAPFVAPCDVKRIYADEADALRAMRKLQRKALQPWRLNVYFCDRHQGWHVGRKSLAVEIR